MDAVAAAEIAPGGGEGKAKDNCPLDVFAADSAAKV
jgi:hypothetical protein